MQMGRPIVLVGILKKKLEVAGNLFRQNALNESRTQALLTVDVNGELTF